MTDWEFVFDGVVGFLLSPMWNVPIVTFIENNCVVFEPSDENELAYTEIHKEYGLLVEELLMSYLKDVGITEEQFVSACEAGSNDKSKVTDRSIFEQVWAGEDYHLFKKIMVKKNLDLEVQALHMIQQRNGVVPEAFSSENDKSSKKKSRQKHQIDEESLMKNVMEQSKQEYENEKRKKREIESMEKTLACSREDSERLHKLAERELNELERIVTLTLRLENARAKDETSNTKNKAKVSSQSEASSQKNPGKPAEVKSAGKPSAKESSKKTSAKESSKKTGKTSPPQKSSSQPSSVQAKPSSAKQNSETSPTTKAKSVAEPSVPKACKNEVQKPPLQKPRQAASESQLPVIGLSERTPAEAAADWILSAKAEVGTSSSNNPADSKNEKSPMEDEVVKRANYMRMQREKLLVLKKQERAKRLKRFEEEQPVKRPMSSRVAYRITQGIEAEKSATNEVSEQEPKKLGMSQALKERIRKEILKEC